MLFIALLLPLPAAGLRSSRSRGSRNAGPPRRSRATCSMDFANPFNLVYLGAVTLVVFACGGVLRRQGSGPCASPFSSSGFRGARLAYRLQVLDFIAGEIEHANLFAQYQAATPGRYRAGRLLLLRLLGGKLPHRHLCRIVFRAGQNLGQVALFTAYFPKIFAGPIERATSYSAAAIVRATRRSDSFALAAIDRLGLVQESRHRRQPWAGRRSQLQDRPRRAAVELLISTYFFAFQIYCDFSG